MGVRGWGVLLKGIYMKVNKITVCAIFRLGLALLLSYPVTDLNAGIKVSRLDFFLAKTKQKLMLVLINLCYIR